MPACCWSGLLIFVSHSCRLNPAWSVINSIMKWRLTSRTEQAGRGSDHWRYASVSEICTSSMSACSLTTMHDWFWAVTHSLHLPSPWYKNLWIVAWLMSASSLPCMLSSAVGIPPIATLSAASPETSMLANVYCPCNDLMATVKRSLAVLCFFKNCSSSDLWSAAVQDFVTVLLTSRASGNTPVAVMLRSKACMQWRLDKPMYIRKVNLVTRSTCTVVDNRNQITSGQFCDINTSKIPELHWYTLLGRIYHCT